MPRPRRARLAGITVATLLEAEGKTFAVIETGRIAEGESQSLAVGEGRIVHSDEGKVAMYRDEHGAVHAVSPVCTHRGCYVQWNSAERNWDCPCHGSRIDSKVLHGPAIGALKSVGESEREED